MAEVEMEIVDGVRYRPEDVKAAKERAAKSEKSATPQNKARKAVSNKTASGSNSDKE